ncbi:MAG: LLM class F420-dependent oxidoreductase [Dehalococcoidia bacterium]
MEIGLHLPHMGPLATREGLTGFARMAEERGFESLWVSDHVIIPRNLKSRYPYSRDGSFPLPPELPMLEPLATLQFVAAVTERAKLGTTILVAPMRNPIVTAKQFASIDVLSSGRLIIGVGAGWMAEEFEMLGVPFAKRGARLDEYIQLFNELYTKDEPSFHGTFWQIDEVGFAPKPVQKPHPPIWVGGHSAPALRRAGRHADAWHAAYVGPDLLRQQFQQVREHAEAAGRDPNSVELTVRTRLPLNDPAAAVEQLQQLQELGVKHLVTEIFTMDLERSGELMDVLAKDVRLKAGV